LRIKIDKHGAIIGDTQSGKTVLANQLYKKAKKALVIDIEDVGQFKGKVFTIKNRPQELIHHLQTQGKAIYVPTWEKAKQKNEINFLWKMLIHMKEHIAVFVDETQHYGDSRTNLFDGYAVRGLKHGVHLISISQRIANISKTIMNNTTKTIFFDLGDYEESYFKQYGLSAIYEEVKELETLPKYSFKIYEKGVGISRAYKLKL